MNHFLRRTVPTLLLGFLSWTAALAQSTDATLSGLVTDNKKEGIPGASVQIRNESTGFTSATLTNADGRYIFQQLPLGGPYKVTVSYVGYTTQNQVGYSLNQGDLARADFTLTESAEQLQEVTVTANTIVNRIERLGGSTALTARNVSKLAVQDRNFAGLAALAPTTNGGNIGSQLASSTNFLIDGMSSRNMLTSGQVGGGPFTLSIEAVREFEVVYNDYDVTMGRQGGGAISAVTKSGTNTLTGAAFVYNRAGFTASKYDIRGNARTVDFSNTQWGFSLGGPIVKDKAHFFLVFDRQDLAQPFFIADIRNDDDANRLGISRGALDSVVSIGRELYGLGRGQQFGEFARKSTANTIFARVDWQLSPKHRLTFRNNFSNWYSPTSVDDNSNINLFESWTNFGSLENSAVLSLRSTFSPRFTNEFKIQYQHAQREFTPNDQLPAANIPRAIVTVRSTLPNGRLGNASVQLGGQRFTPETNLLRQFQLVNTTYLNLGKVNLAFGTDNLLTYMDIYISNEQNGRFFFNGLSEFANRNPNRYAREVPLRGKPTAQQFVLDASAFVQAEMNLHPHLKAKLGLRYDVTAYLTPAAYNPAVEQALGLRTDARIGDYNNIQPRLQLTWDIGGRNTDILRFGAGMFSAYVINYAQINNIQNTGLGVAAVDVSRPANATPQNPGPVPRPDFPAYRADPSTAPGVLAGAPSVSTINLNDPNFQVPTIYKANLTYSKIVNTWLRVGANLLVSQTVNNYVYIDQNLREPAFRINAEPIDASGLGRAVFVPASSISTRTGLTDNTLGRRAPQVGRTLMFTNGATLRTATLILDADVRLPRGGNFTVSYALNDARDNTSYNGNVANTSTFRPVKSDPRSLSEINYSDNQFRHKLVLYGLSPEVAGFALSARFSGISGTRWSALVGADVNGDFVGQAGVANDLAFLFDPNNPATPANIRTGLASLTNETSASRGKDYLLANFGGMANRNGGENKALVGVVDVRLSKVFRFLKSQSVELSVDVFNLANLLNRNWGGNFNLGNQNLYNLPGSNAFTYDATNNNNSRYNYNVNTNFGTIQKQGTPYQIQLGLRYGF